MTTTARVICCDAMPSELGTRIVHILNEHQGDLPPDLYAQVRTMLDDVATRLNATFGYD